MLFVFSTFNVLLLPRGTTKDLLHLFQRVL